MGMAKLETLHLFIFFRALSNWNDPTLNKNNFYVNSIAADIKKTENNQRHRLKNSYK